MKELKTFVQEPYEAPAIIDVLPVTTVHVFGEESVTPGPEDNGDDF